MDIIHGYGDIRLTLKVWVGGVLCHKQSSGLRAGYHDSPTSMCSTLSSLHLLSGHLASLLVRERNS
eukprot:scaffold57404_cov16-Tisochrysis_lutea.AAC.1